MGYKYYFRDNFMNFLKPKQNQIWISLEAQKFRAQSALYLEKNPKNNEDPEASSAGRVCGPNLRIRG